MSGQREGGKSSRSPTAATVPRSLDKHAMEAESSPDDTEG